MTSRLQGPSERFAAILCLLAKGWGTRCRGLCKMTAVDLSDAEKIARAVLLYVSIIAFPAALFAKLSRHFRDGVSTTTAVNIELRCVLPISHPFQGSLHSDSPSLPFPALHCRGWGLPSCPSLPALLPLPALPFCPCPTLPSCPSLPCPPALPSCPSLLPDGCCPPVQLLAAQEAVWSPN